VFTNKSANECAKESQWTVKLNKKSQWKLKAKEENARKAESWRWVLRKLFVLILRLLSFWKLVNGFGQLLCELPTHTFGLRNQVVSIIAMMARWWGYYVTSFSPKNPWNVSASVTKIEIKSHRVCHTISIKVTSNKASTAEIAVRFEENRGTGKG